MIPIIAIKNTDSVINNQCGHEMTKLTRTKQTKKKIEELEKRRGE
jgi:hypothetical protein